VLPLASRAPVRPVTTPERTSGRIRQVTRTPHPEVLVSVDVETSGPTPGTGSLIALGACLVVAPA